MKPLRAMPQASQKLRVSGLNEPVEVRRHAGARRMTLRVSHTSRSVIVTLPLSLRSGAGGQISLNDIDWVRERLVDLPVHVPFRHGSSVPLRGVSHAIVEIGPRRGPVVELASCAAGRPQLVVSGEGDHVERRLRDWLAVEARRDPSSSASLGTPTISASNARRVTVRDQKSRWGSCSSNGSLSFSWRLIMAPPHVLDYVAAHEVAHLREMNHGPRFWGRRRQDHARLRRGEALAAHLRQRTAPLRRRTDRSRAGRAPSAPVAPGVASAMAAERRECRSHHHLPPARAG